MLKKLKIPVGSGAVSAILESPSKPKAGLTLAHGAGAGMNHEFLEKLSKALVSAGFAVLRFQFPYMEAGQKRTDRPEKAAEAIGAARDALQERVDAPLIAAGKSFGARMTTWAESQGLLEGLSGIIAFGFPLHPAGEPSLERAAHLSKTKVPLLFLQGSRDELCDLTLMRKVCSKLRRAQLHVVEAADHGFGVLKRSGRTSEEVLQELSTEAARFRDQL